MCGPAIKFADFFAFCGKRAVAGGRVKRRNSGAARANPLGERSLRIQLDVDFFVHRQLFECVIFAHIAGDHFLHLLVLKQEADAEIVDAGVIRN